MNAQRNSKQGFTIIEVVLVLAIAALIFLMVFIALPALQSGQRDTARRGDASSVAGAVQNYLSTERRPIQSGQNTELRRYVNDLDQYEPTDVVVLGGISGATGRTAIPVNDTHKQQIRVFVGDKCDGTSVVRGTSRTAAVVVVLEQGNGNQPHCVDV